MITLCEQGLKVNVPNTWVIQSVHPVRTGAEGRTKASERLGLMSVPA